MPNVAKVLKEEISRIGRKEAKAACTPLQKRTIKLERFAADLKRRVALLEKENRQLQGQLKTIEVAQPAPQEPAGRAWISGKGVKNLRKRLGLTQVEFAKLVRVSHQAVVNWEKKPGMLKFRAATKASLFSVRSIGAREAKRRLEEMKAKVKKPVAKPRKQSRRK